MKNKLLVLIVAFMFAGVSSSFGQFAFGVSPGLNFNKAYFGFKVAEKIVPFIGIQYGSVKFNNESSRMTWDGANNQAVNNNETSELKGSIFMPNVGVKFFALEKNSLKAFAQVNFAIPLIKAEEVRTDTWPTDFIDENTTEEVVDAASAWALEFGIGVEYFFDENFSIGGEFGYRSINGKFDYTHTQDYWDPNAGEYVDYEANDFVKISASPTYSRISLNFYF